MASAGSSSSDTLAFDIAALAEEELARAATGDADPAATAFLARHVEALLEGARDRADFTAPMNLFLDSATGAGFWRWYGAMGAYGGLQCPTIEKRRDGAAASCRIILGGAPYWLSALVDGEGKIAQLALW